MKPFRIIFTILIAFLFLACDGIVGSEDDSKSSGYVIPEGKPFVFSDNFKLVVSVEDCGDADVVAWEEGEKIIINSAGVNYTYVAQKSGMVSEFIAEGEDLGTISNKLPISVLRNFEKVIPEDGRGKFAFSAERNLDDEISNYPMYCYEPNPEAVSGILEFKMKPAVSLVEVTLIPEKPISADYCQITLDGVSGYTSLTEGILYPNTGLVSGSGANNPIRINFTNTVEIKDTLRIHFLLSNAILQSGESILKAQLFDSNDEESALAKLFLNFNSNLALNPRYLRFETIIRESRKPGISNLKEFFAFAEAVNAGDKTASMFQDENGIVPLNKDLDFGGQLIPVIKVWSGILDGKGYKIYNFTLPEAKSDNGLILQNDGVIKNLIVGSSDGKIWDGVSEMSVHTMASNARVGVVALNEGEIDNVVSFLNYDIPSKVILVAKNPYYCGGIVGLNKGLISNCEYRGQMIIPKMPAASTIQPMFGGITGAVSDNGVVKTSSNYSPIATSMVAKQHVGGIVGLLNGGIIESCTNYAKLTLANSHHSSGYRDSYIAGIAGASTTKSSEIKSCINEGDIVNSVSMSSNAPLPIAAGILGMSNQGSGVTMLVEDCVNKANITITNAQSYRSFAGGIVGMSSANGLIIRGAVNYGSITASYPSIPSQSGAGGVFGYISKEGALVTKCANFGIITGKLASQTGSIGGRTLGKTTQCKVGGSVNGVDLTETNFASYIVGSASTITPTDCVFAKE